MTSLLEQLSKEIEEARKHTVPSGTPSGPLVHGPGGLFGVEGLERDVISSRLTPMGLASQLPAVGSITEYPLYAYISGRNQASGSQPESDCGNAPEAGNLLTCFQTAQFGIYQFRTRELNINSVGRIVNAGETTDLRYVNDPLAAQLGRIFPQVDNSDVALRLGREVLMRLVEVGFEFQEELSKQIYTGTGTGNEFPGLEVLVSETHYDAKTGTSCTSLASDVRDFGDVSISDAAGSSAIVTQLVSMYRFAKHSAKRMRLAPVQFAFVMQEQAFHEIADIWPCAYLTSRCGISNTSGRVFVNADEQVRLRIEMRQGEYLLIDDEPVPVITDDFLPEDDLGESVFSSDIYLLPLSIQGGRQTLYWEYIDYSRTALQAVRDGRLTDTFWTDRGQYLWVKQPPQNWCTVWQAKIEPRVRLEVPQVAGRLQNVAYSASKHYRSADPASAYYESAGEGARTAETLYNEWSNTP